MATGVDAKLLKSTKFPPIFNQKVDMQKVNLQVMKKWIAGRISDILGNDDDVVIELCYNLIESVRNPDIKSLQIQLTGFLESQTAEFCKELWALLLSAQTNPQGIPRELLEAKKLELIQEKIEAEKAAEEAHRNSNRSGNFGRDRNLRGGDRGDARRGGGNQGRRGNDSRRGGGPTRGNDGPGVFGRPRGRETERSRSPPGRGRDFRGRGERGGFRANQHDLYAPSDRRSDSSGRRGIYRRRRSSSRSTYSRSWSRSSTGRPSSSRSRSRSGQRARPRSRSPSRRDKRARSPEHSGRSNGRRSRRRSVSASRSPIAKRRRYSPSRSPVYDRRRRSTRSLSSSGSSRFSQSDNDRSRNRWRRGGRGRGRSTSWSRSRSSSRDRRRSRSLSFDEDDTGRLKQRGSDRGRSRGDASNGAVNKNGDAADRRRLSSSVSSRSRSRSRSPLRSGDKSADVSGRKDRLTTEATSIRSEVTAVKPDDTNGVPQRAKDSQTIAAERLANEQREKELKERVKQMRALKKT